MSSSNVPAANVALISRSGIILGATIKIGLLVASAGAVVAVIALALGNGATVGVGVDLIKAGAGTWAIGLAGFARLHRLLLKQQFEGESNAGS